MGTELLAKLPLGFVLFFYFSYVVFSEFLRSVVWCLLFILGNSEPVVLQIFLQTCLLSSGIPVMCMSHCLILSHSSWMFCSFVFTFLLFVFQFG